MGNNPRGEKGLCRAHHVWYFLHILPPTCQFSLVIRSSSVRFVRVDLPNKTFLKPLIRRLELQSSQTKHGVRKPSGAGDQWSSPSAFWSFQFESPICPGGSGKDSDREMPFMHHWRTISPNEIRICNPVFWRPTHAMLQYHQLILAAF